MQRQSGSHGSHTPHPTMQGIPSGLRDQLKRDGTVIDGHAGMYERSVTKDVIISLCAAQERADLVEVNGHVLKFDNVEGPFFDDLTKQELPAPLVKAANRKELEYFDSKGVWRKVSIHEAWKISGRPSITILWVDVNTGDDPHPDMRSRLVAREIRGAHGDPTVAPTPPLEALRTVLSYAATDLEGEKPKS